MDNQKEYESTLSMIAEYMEKGFLENIVDMFKQDKNYYPMIGDLINDERIGVRIGTTALVETLKEEDSDNIPAAIPGIAEVLKKAELSTLRGDAAYLLSIIGHNDAIPYLEDASDDENAQVREAIEEAINDIKTGD